MGNRGGRMREVVISAVANGWIVTVGCQRFVYDDKDKLSGDLRDYLADPVATEERIMKTAQNARFTMGAIPGNPNPTGIMLTGGGCNTVGYNSNPSAFSFTG
jgi:hypothetical protein